MIVARSLRNGAPYEFHAKYRSAAISFPRTNWFKLINIDVHMFPAGTVVLESAFENEYTKLQTVGGKHHTVKNFNFMACDGDLVDWNGPRYNVIFDEDGSFTGTGKPTYITPYHEHFNYPIA